MKVIAKIPGENNDLAVSLRKIDLDAGLVKDHVMVEFIDDLFPEISQKLPKTTEYKLKAYERGGAKTNTGRGVIICSPEGRRLVPKELYVTGHLANGRHAMFLESHFMVICSTKHGEITMTEVKILPEENRIRTIMFWKGHFLDLPNTYNNFLSAASIAHIKANKYHCREALYYNDTIMNNRQQITLI